MNDINILTLYTKLKGYLRKYLKNEDDIEDIVQETFLKTIEISTKGTIHYPSTYLYKTARNLAINSITRNYHELFDFIENFPADMSLLESGALEDDAIESEKFLQFCRVASKLPEQCRKVLILRKVYGYKQVEVAEMLAISVSTVDKHLVKAILRCSDYMQKQNATFDIEVNKWKRM